MREVIYDTPGDNNYFPIPDDCNVIFVSGCGGGGGGNTASGASGAPGGGAAPCFLRVPLSVTPGGVLGIRVGIGGLAGESMNTEGYKRISSISGVALLSPLCAASYLPFFSMGFGEHGGGGGHAGIYCTTTAGGCGTRVLLNSGTGGDWSYGSKTLPVFLMPPIIKGDGAQAPPSSPYHYGQEGLRTFMDGGMGVEYASDPTYSSGGAGGGGLFGKGGAGGVYSGSPGNGGDGTGYGTGGGGGSGGPNPYGIGGNGSPGIVIIEY